MSPLVLEFFEQTKTVSKMTMKVAFLEGRECINFIIGVATIDTV